ncbi:MAG: hypothetical protein ACI4MF_12100 [Candidatus Faecivicinus sp.]
MNEDIIILMDEDTALNLLHEHYHRIMQSRDIIARALDYLKRTGSSRLNRYPAHLADCEMRGKTMNSGCAAAVRESCFGILQCAAHLEEMVQHQSDHGGIVFEGCEHRFISSMFPSYPESLREVLAADLELRLQELEEENDEQDSKEQRHVPHS